MKTYEAVILSGIDVCEGWRRKLKSTNSMFSKYLEDKKKKIFCFLF